MAKTFGRTIRQIRDATDDIKRDIRNSTSEIEKEISGARNQFNESSKSVTDSFTNQTKELENIGKKFKNTLESSDGKEHVSNKRKPITDKFVSEEELISSDNEISHQTALENDESGLKEPIDSSAETELKPETSNKKGVVKNKTEVKETSETTIPEESNSKPLSKTKTDKDPEA